MISMQSCFTSFFHAPGVFCRGHHVMCVVLSWISSPWHFLTLRMGGLTMCHVQTPCCAWPNQKQMETWNAFPAWIILNPAPPKDWTAVTCVSVTRPLQQQKVGTYRCGRSGAAQNMALGLARILRSDDLELAEGAEAYERVAPEPEGLGQKPRGLTKECKAGLRNEANRFLGGLISKGVQKFQSSVSFCPVASCLDKSWVSTRKHRKCRGFRFQSKGSCALIDCCILCLRAC